jgi:hypothetical protein
MRWRRNWLERPSRPKVRRLSADENCRELVGIVQRHVPVRVTRRHVGCLPDQAGRAQEHRLGGSLAGEAEMEGVVIMAQTTNHP